LVAIVCCVDTGSTLILTKGLLNVCIMERRVKNNCYHMAKCGLTTLSKCKTQKANLKECESCKLVTRVADRWKMIDRKPHRKCWKCGVFLPLDMYYPKRIKKPDGTIYETVEGICKKCRSREYMKKKWEKLCM
jgi:hypothetical protein